MLIQSSYNSFANKKKLYSYFDENNQGSINGEDLFNYTEKIGENVSYEECCEIIKKLNNEKTAAITLKDFKRICKTKIQ